MIAIRDQERHGWVLYPHGVAGLCVLTADGDAHILADDIGPAGGFTARRAGDH